MTATVIELSFLKFGAAGDSPDEAEYAPCSSCHETERKTNL